MLISSYKPKKQKIMSDLILDDDIMTKEGQISPKAKQLLINTGKWTIFLSITGYIFIALLAIAFLTSIFTESINPYISFTGNGIIGFLIFIIIAVVIIIPTTLLFNFSKKINKATSFSKDKDYEAAFDYLKRNFVFIGSTSFVLISIYLLILGYRYMNEFSI
jgi:hypothetical protein